MTPTDKQTLWNAILKLNNKPYIGSGYGAYNNVKNPALRGGLYNWKYRDMRELYEQLVKYCELGEYEATSRVLQKYKTKIYPAYLRQIYQTLNCATGPVPLLSTEVVTDVNIIGSATTGGNITDDGGNPILAKGVCWSTSPNPTLADNFTVEGTGIGSFVSNLSLLPLDTTYYVRAYATSIAGTGYGNEQTFTTPPSFVDVGTQNWSTTNLRVSTYRNGDPIPFAANSSQWVNYNSSQTGAWRYYNDDPSTELIYGRYYNSYAVLDSRLIAPTGYHIPTLEEWPILNTYLISNSESMANLKNISLNVWTAPNTDATNAYLFEAVPGGAIPSDGSNAGYNMPSWAYYWMYTQGGGGGNLNKLKYSYFGFDGSSSPDNGWTNIGQGLTIRIIDNDSLVRGQAFGGGMLLENTGTEGITAWTIGRWGDISAIANAPFLGEQWGCSGTIIGAGSVSDGYANTQLMDVAACNVTSGKLAAGTNQYNEYRDWYIPACEEVLNQIQAVPEYQTILNTTYNYWTSTEVNDTEAMALTYDIGSGNWVLIPKPKGEIYLIVAMRKQQL